MTKEVLSKELWALTNIITGFAVVQTVAFTYACLKPEFSDPKITMSVKITIAIFLILVTVAQCYSISWCTIKCIALIDTDEKADRELLTQVLKQAEWRRIIVIGVLIVPCLLCLFAKETGSLVKGQGDVTLYNQSWTQENEACRIGFSIKNNKNKPVDRRVKIVAHIAKDVGKGCVVGDVLGEKEIFVHLKAQEEKQVIEILPLLLNIRPSGVVITDFKP